MDEIKILLVEDNKLDVVLVQEALKEAGLGHRLEVASDGDAALQVLYAARFKPHIILLDLNLPKRSGLEVLKEVKRDPSLRQIPTIIMTNSLSEDDVTLAYASHCNAYIRKRLGFDSIQETMSLLIRFWFECATLPKPAPESSTLPEN